MRQRKKPENPSERDCRHKFIWHNCRCIHCNSLICKINKDCPYILEQNFLAKKCVMKR